MCGDPDIIPDEIEVSPAMADAGAGAYLKSDMRFDLVEEISSRIYRTMEAVRRSEVRLVNDPTKAPNP